MKKRLVAALIAVSLIFGSLVAPKRSEAIFGLALFAPQAALGAVPLAGAGLTVTFLLSAASAAGAIEFFMKAQKSSGTQAVFNYLVALGAAVGGVFLLDGSANQPATLVSITPERAAALGMNEAEYRAYESELPLINAVAEEVLSRTEAQFASENPGSARFYVRVATVLHETWNDLGAQTLSPEARIAVQKLGAGVRL